MRLSVAVYLLLVFTTMSYSYRGCDGYEESMRVQNLPVEIDNFVYAHFLDRAVKSVKHTYDDDARKERYKVKLYGGVELKFNGYLEIIEIESKRALPDSVIPGRIRDYVYYHFPNNMIVEWELESDGRQEVKLNNGVEIKFDRFGNFLKLDT